MKLLKSAISFAVNFAKVKGSSYVFFVRNIVKIFCSWVLLVLVFMTNFHSFWTWAEEVFGHNLMKLMSIFLPSTTPHSKGDDRIASFPIEIGPEYFPRMTITTFSEPFYSSEVTYCIIQIPANNLPILHKPIISQELG